MLNDFDDPRRGTGAQAGVATTRNSPVDRFGLDHHEDEADGEMHPLDQEKAVRLHKNMMAHYLRELDIQRDNRAEMEMDEAFYDHDQWSSYDAAIVRKRGQEPLVYNVVATTLNWMLGTERRTRSDYKILPRTKSGSQAAERKSQILKYLADVNRSEFSWSQAFAEAAKAGLGWMECGVQEEDEGEPVYERAESWRNILSDSAAVEMDARDARFQFRSKWTDVDTAKKFFPDRAEIIDAAATVAYDLGTFLDRDGDDAMDSHEEQLSSSRSNNNEFADAGRRRVRLIEGWMRVPMLVKRISGGDFSGEIFDSYSEGHRDEVMTGRATIRESTTMRVHVMIMTTAGALWFSPSPYRHNRYPFTPIWGYRKSSTLQPYGVIRGIRDMQRDINKRASKALAILSSNKVIMDKGAVDDLDEFAEEISRPDAIIVKNAGKDIRIDSDRDLAAAHLDIMSMSINMVQQTSGVTDENMGRSTNATSGKAIGLRQDQGALATAMIFDNLRFARQVHGEKLVSLVEQFVTDQKQFRITNRRGSPDFITVNDGLPENDIVRTKADFIITDDDWNATLRQAQTQELMNLMAQLAPVAPQIVLIVIDLLVESMDVPNRDEIVKRIRQATGALDPDADPDQPPDKEEVARMQAKQEQADMEKRAADANVSKIEADVREKNARAAKIEADIQTLIKAIPGDDLETKRKSLELAMSMIAARAAVPVADRLLSEAGFNFALPTSAGGEMPGAGSPMMPPPQALAPAPMPQNY